MSASLTVDASKLQKALKAFIGNTKLEAAGEMRRQARLLCVKLANSTQPFGLGNDVKKIGEKAITRDINRVYKTPGTASKEIAKLSIPNGKTKTQNAEQMAKAFANLVLGKAKGNEKRRRTESAQQLLNRIRQQPYVGTQVGPFDNGKSHQAARYGKSKRVPKNQFVQQVVTKDSPLARYFKDKRGNVGIAKSGWAVCAGILGGFRGIPKWVYRHTGGGRVIDQTKSGIISKPFIQMTNTIPWINNVISNATIQKSIDIQVINMIKQLSKIAAYESKKAGL
jgi:hypothetical protein